ncbi:MAG: aminotransferase class IV [Cyclobacteriaceae bacterium]|nr:MAG: aminotransferase class IV [Cyclobacteriaceae bacterium]
MFRLIESIRLEDGECFNLHYHQQRMDQSVLSLSGTVNKIQLASVLQEHNLPATGKFKCRIVYSETGVAEMTITPYELRTITSLKIICDNTIDYSLKFEDRSSLNNLFAQRNDCDDILIVKNGFVTDASYSNVVFYDGLRWITPAQPLLKGIMRQFLLDSGVIHEDAILVDQIPLFKKVKLVNALLGFEGPELSVSQIVF